MTIGEIMSDRSKLERLMEKRYSYRSKAVGSIAVCLLGAVSMYLSKGQTGVGYAIIGLYFIWS